MADPNAGRELEAVVRGVATAAKTLRLYPSTSPIPHQSADAAVTALQSYLAGEPVLALAVVRDGFACGGEPVAVGMPSAADLADLLRSHGVAEVDFLAGCGTQELLGFLDVLGRAPEDVRASGGLAALVTAEAIENIRVTDVALTVAEETMPADVENVDEFLRELATDPNKLAAWIAAAAHGDPAALAEGLAELRRAAAADARLAQSLATAFEMLDADGRDAILTVSMEPGEVRQLAGSAFGLLPTDAIANALAQGVYGQNMLSLSSALTRLPLAERMRSVFGELSSALEAVGKSAKERDFLDHMVEVRTKGIPEPSLTDADGYRQIAEMARASAEEVGEARTAAADEHEVSRRSVDTLLMLLDQQGDFDLYCGAADSVAGTVPTLLKQGDLKLATRVIAELATRATRAKQPWPGLDERLRASMKKAFSASSIKGLLAAVVADPACANEAAELVRHAGDAAYEQVATEAIPLKAPGLAAAELLIGRRLVDQLAMLAPRLQWYQVGPVARRLACESDHRASEALRGLIGRADEQSRREAAQGLSEAGSAGVPPLARMLRDSSLQVVIVAARGLARSGATDGARAIGARLDELDIDGKDFLAGREMISALARIPGDESAAVLRKLASRKALIKRGHFAEVQQLASQALDLQSKAGRGAA